MIKRGINYFLLRDIYQDGFPKASTDKPRVFISHQKKDSDIAKKIADYLLNAGVDIYFDEYDVNINRDDPNSVVTAIRYGIENCTHMLVIFSPNTFNSMWVPWEIGYAYNSSISLNVLRLKDVAKDKLPEYLKVVKVLFDIWDLNYLISLLTNNTSEQLLKEGRIHNYSDKIHPLAEYVDSI